MKIFLNTLLSALILICVFCMPGISGETKTPDLSKLPGVAKTEQFTGNVKAVNHLANSVTITKKMGKKTVDVTVTVDNATMITMEKVKKTFADIKAGDNVVVTYTSIDGKNVAKSIFIKPVKKEPARK